MLGTASLTPLDLASDAPIGLYAGTEANRALYVRTTDAPRGELVNIGPSGETVPAAPKGVLVKHGTAVVFSTLEATPRIIERDLTTGTSTVRLSGADLLDASEDGNVITYSRALANAGRPAGTKPLPDDKRAPAEFAVGYQVGSGPARVVDVTRGEQLRTGDPTLEIPEHTYWKATTPLDLQVSQTGGRYSLVLSLGSVNTNYPYQDGEFRRLSADGSTVLDSYSSQISITSLLADPVSGAYTTIRSSHASSGTYNQAAIVDGSGRRIELSTGSAAPQQFVKAIPTNAGAGAVFTAFNRDAEGLSGAWAIDELGAPGVDATPWLDLPRSGDTIDSPALKADVKWLNYPDTSVPPTPVAGALADYAAVTVKTTGNSAASIAFTPAPQGKIAAKSVRANLTFLGFELWSRSLAKPGTINLPGIPPYFPFLATTVKVTLADGTALTKSTALSRTR
ncbi:MAG: hypothetical protein PGN13_03440 [Patulibacter minatonensis]